MSRLVPRPPPQARAHRQGDPVRRCGRVPPSPGSARLSTARRVLQKPAQLLYGVAQRKVVWDVEDQRLSLALLVERRERAFFVRFQADVSSVRAVGEHLAPEEVERGATGCRADEAVWASSDP